MKRKRLFKEDLLKMEGVKVLFCDEDGRVEAIVRKGGFIDCDGSHIYWGQGLVLAYTSSWDGFTYWGSYEDEDEVEIYEIEEEYSYESYWY